MKEVLLYKEMRQHQIAGVQVLLDHHEIPYRVADENTGVLLGEIVASAIGGIKIYVPEDRYSQAKALLTENGYISEEQAAEEATVSPGLSKIAALFFKYQKALLWASLALLLAIVVWVIADQPSEFELVINRDWCVEEMVVATEEQLAELDRQIDGDVEEEGVLVFINFGCEQSMRFDHTGNFSYTVGQRSGKGTWRPKGDSIVLNSLNDDLTFLTGVFHLDVDKSYVILSNPNLQMLAYEDTWIW